MSHSRINTLVLGAALIGGLLVTDVARAETSDEPGFGPRAQISLLGGIQALNKNDTSIPDHFINIPTVASLSYQLTPRLAAEGEFTWMIPVKQSVDISGVSVDRKNPDILAYQAGLRALFPSRAWTPYVAAGAGAVTFLSNTDADRVPQLDKSETAFAVNFGGGTSYNLSEKWALRGDFRELVAFPKDGAAGLSNASGTDNVWMERGALGLAYRF